MKVNNIATPSATSFGMNPTNVKKTANRILNSDLASKTLNYKGLNMTFPVLMGVMLGGVLLPRVIQAKDKYDKAEIVRRDTISIATMGVGAAVLGKAFSKINEARSGFVLTDNVSKTKNPIKRLIENLSPEKGIQVLSSDELATKYGKINEYRDGVQGFCEFIDKKGGKLNKIFGSDNATKQIISDLMGGEEALKSADNKTIIESIKNAPKDTLETIGNLFGKETKKLEDIPLVGIRKAIASVKNKTIDVTQGVSTEFNKFVTKAKSMNSSFGFLSMVVIVPLFLGFLLPAINEKATKKKVAEEQAAKSKTSTASTVTNTKTPNIQNVEKVFNKIQNFQK